jgi:hypothetical protein
MAGKGILRMEKGGELEWLLVREDHGCGVSMCFVALGFCEAQMVVWTGWMER